MFWKKKSYTRIDMNFCKYELMRKKKKVPNEWKVYVQLVQLFTMLFYARADLKTVLVALRISFRMVTKKFKLYKI